MNNRAFCVTGNDLFSIKLAHARATTMLLHDVSSIGNNSMSFVVERNLESRQQNSERLFILWCERITSSKKNHVRLQHTYSE
ncbi:MAG: hypothetical protein GY808_09870 [Gammaproteobacteria bacterium]|nr:hypothetical protein [Gammaproteobacteria bacterium]